MNYDRNPQLDRLAAEYVLGTMQARARRRFERLLRDSPAARTATDAWTHRMHLLSGVESRLEPSQDLFARIEKRIDQGDRSADPGPLKSNPRAARRAPASIRLSWLRPALGFALGVMVSWGVIDAVRPVRYETLTTGPAQTAAPTRTLRLLFAPRTTVEQMNTALRSVGAAIVAGPTDLGVLTVSIPEGLSLERASTTLRAYPAVRLAEPVVDPKGTL